MRRPVAVGALLAACVASIATSSVEPPAFSGRGHEQGPNVLLTPEQPVWWLEVRAETTLPAEATAFLGQLGITLEPDSDDEPHVVPVSCEDGSPIVSESDEDDGYDYPQFDSTVHDVFAGCAPGEPCVAVACFQAEKGMVDTIALRWRGEAFIESEDRYQDAPNVDVEITVSADAWPVSP